MTQISAFWFKRLSSIIENHVVASTLEEFPPGVRSQVEPHWADKLEGRTLLVRKARVVKLEAIVRGYLTGKLLGFGLYVLTANGWEMHLIRFGMGGV